MAPTYWVSASYPSPCCKLQAATAPAAAARLVGQVLDGQSGAPLAGARVTLAGQSLSSQIPRLPEQVMTDEGGRFVFTHVAPGRYRITADKAGFAIDPQNARVVDVGPAAAGAGITLTLQRGGAIAGMIVDGRGDPVPDLLVTAVRQIAGRGNRSTISTGSGSMTNDRGEFRVASLLPGEYVVIAAPRTGPVQQPGATTMIRTYYPGGSEIQSATPITVRAGETAAGVNFMMLSAPAFHVSGVVVDAQGQPRAGAMVRLMPRAFQASMAMPVGAATNQDGTFRIGGVVSGSYRLIAIMPPRSSQAVLPGGIVYGVVGGVVGQQPSLDVDVNGGDVTGVTLLLSEQR